MSSAVDERPRVDDPVAILHDSLASMCRSGVALPRAFAMLEPDLRKGPLRDAVAGLAHDLDEGVPLAEAYARHERAFPRPYAALIAAGVASGDLAGALAEIARHAERRARIARALRSAMAGPLVTAAFVVVIGAALVATIGPRFAAIEDSVGAGVLGGASHAQNAMRVALGCLVALGMGVALTFVTAWLRNPLDGFPGAASLTERLPVIGRIRRYAGLAGVLSTLTSLVRRGVSLPEALDLSAEAVEDRRLRRRVLAMAEAAHDGAGLQVAARTAGLLPASELWLLRAAEERGAPEEALDDLATYYSDRLERAVGRAVATVGPVIELIVGVVVFVLAYTFVVPVSQLAMQVLEVL